MATKQGAVKVILVTSVTLLVAASCGDGDTTSYGTSQGGTRSSTGGVSGGGSSRGGSSGNGTSGDGSGGDGSERGGAPTGGIGASTDGGGSGAAGGDDAGVPLRVLFVGNSYTYVNDLPAVVRALGAATPGGAVEVESITVGGVTLAEHWATTGARPRIAMGGLDVVVLQGQSVEALDAESIYGYGMLFSDAVAAAGARAVWFATWARREGDPLYAQLGLNPASMTLRIEQGYALAAEDNGDVVARVGAAWQLALAELPDVILHTEDGSHPSAAGTLLAGCVILQAVTGQTPRLPDPPPLDVPVDTARALCAIAPRVRCLAGMGFCGGECVDLEYNPEHCGACNITCQGEDPCRARVCGCSAGFSGCDRRCVDWQTDTGYCGDCDTACSVGAVCRDGDCSCPSGSPQPITYETLAALRPACITRDNAGSLDCNAAAHELCAALDCHDSGFGPPSGHAPTVEAVMCVGGDVRRTTYTELATVVAGCDGISERLGQNCTTAVHRYCVGTGAVSGFGPVTDGAGDGVTVTCVPSATVVHTTDAVLRTHASRCVPDPVTCGIASWNFCTSMGLGGGFGPVEASGDDREVVCFER